MKAVGILAVVAFGFGSAPAADKDGPKELIMGKWEGEANKLKYGYEFKDDGVVMVTIPGGNTSSKQSYKWLDDSTIEMVIGKTKLKYAVTVTKDELTLKDAAKKTEMKLTRPAK